MTSDTPTPPTEIEALIAEYRRIRNCSPHEPWCDDPSVGNIDHFDGHIDARDSILERIFAALLAASTREQELTTRLLCVEERERSLLKVRDADHEQWRQETVMERRARQQAESHAAALREALTDVLSRFGSVEGLREITPELAAHVRKTGPIHPVFVADIYRWHAALHAPAETRRETPDEPVEADKVANQLHYVDPTLQAAAHTPTPALPQFVSVVQREKGGVQIEGHTLKGDWELEIDANGDVVSFDGSDTIPRAELRRLRDEWQQHADALREIRGRDGEAHRTEMHIADLNRLLAVEGAQPQKTEAGRERQG